jgi:hypothetical protein
MNNVWLFNQNILSVQIWICSYVFGFFEGFPSAWYPNYICFPYSILHNNSFYGTIPMEIGDLHDLKMLDLGYNNFSGLIPSELQNILSLEFL